MARTFRISAFCLILVGLLVGGASIFAQQPSPTSTPTGNYVVRDNIYVRGGPSEAYQAVGMLRNGDPLIPLSRNDAGTWILINYYRGFGWVRRDLGHWVTNLENLPIIDEANLTPTPVPGVANTAVFIPPTETPEGNWLNVGDLGAYIRTGPGLNFPIYGELEDGTFVEPVGQSEDAQWILLRLDDGFAWIHYSLVSWADDITALNTLEIGALTPSATFTSTQTPTKTATSTSALTPSATYTATITLTPSTTSTDTPTHTPTLTPTFTATHTETRTPTETSTATVTSSPTATFTQLPTNTQVATLIAQQMSITNTATMPPTETPLPPTSTETFTPTLTHTATAQATVTHTSVPPVSTVTDVPATETVNATWTFVAQAVSDAQTATAAAPTNTPRPTITQSDSTPATLSFTLPANTAEASATADMNGTGTSVALFVFSTLTARAVEATTIAPASPDVTSVVNAVIPTQPALINSTTPAAITSSVSTEVVVGGGVLLLAIAYIGFYWRGLSTLERYKAGFVIEKCPVCGNGHLVVETRQERTFGIPRGKYTVRCDECRSVLREAGGNQWRYAIDPMANPMLYERFNNKLIDEASLKALEKQPANLGRTSHVRTPVPPPQFLDDENR